MVTGNRPTSIMLICGSLRAGSTNAALLQTVAVLADPLGVVVDKYDWLERLPHFNPDDDREPLDDDVADLRARIKAADALLFCTPEYAGALPGSFKNLLDWTVGGGETYRKPVAWINVSAGADDAHDSLRKVLERTGTDIVDAACVRIPVARKDVDSDGTVHDQGLRDRIAAAIRILAAHGGAAGI